jgi:hypothetical protein
MKYTTKYRLMKKQPYHTIKLFRGLLTPIATFKCNILKYTGNKKNKHFFY